MTSEILITCIDSWSRYIWHDIYYPDVNLIFVIFIFAGIVLTPFALAYVRCKEDVGALITANDKDNSGGMKWK